MNKTILISIIVVVLVVLVGGYFLFYSGSQSSLYVTNNTNYTPNTSVPPSTNTPPATTTPSLQPQNLTSLVSIKNFAFNPTPLTIKVGTTVIWTNNDSMPHQIKSTTFNSATLNNGQTFSFTFSTAGQYNYSCAIHPSMLGKIIVTQ